jgi:hypothetical protein
MMKKEFEALLGEEVSEADYNLIDHVYNNHPLVKEKEDAVKFWKLGGLVLFADMLPRARRIGEVHAAIQSERIRAENHQTRAAELRKLHADICNGGPLVSPKGRE